MLSTGLDCQKQLNEIAEFNCRNTSNMKSSLSSSLEQLPILIKRGLIGLAIVGSAVGCWSYWQVQLQIRAAERASNMGSELCKIGETYGHLRELGQGRIEDARQNLSIKLANQLSSMEAALASTDEKTREAAEHVMAMIADDQKRHPTYYAISNSTIASSAPAADTTKVPLVYRQTK